MWLISSPGVRVKPVPVLDAAASSVPYGAIPWCLGCKLVSRLADPCISQYAATCGSELRLSVGVVELQLSAGGVSTECRSVCRGKGAVSPRALRRCEKPCGGRPCEASGEGNSAPCLAAASTCAKGLSSSRRKPGPRGIFELSGLSSRADLDKLSSLASLGQSWLGGRGHRGS
jgi:hypothetical protein